MNATTLDNLPPLTENPFEAFTPQLRNLYASVYLTVAGVTLFMYDWLITFSDEWQHIWYGGRITSVKLLYIFNRVLTPAILGVDLYDKGGLAVNMTQDICRWALNFDGWGTIVSYGSIHWIVTLRVWTVYGRSRRLLVFLVVLFAAYFGTTAFMWYRASAEISKTIYPSPVVVKICYTVIPDWMWLLWIPNLVYESVIFVLTVFKAWEHQRVNLNTRLLTVLYRDGFIYFFVICMLSLANMFTWLWAPHSLAILFKYFSLAAVNVAAFRLVLDLRNAGRDYVRQAPVGGVATFRRPKPAHLSLEDPVALQRDSDLELRRTLSFGLGYSKGRSQTPHAPESALQEGRSWFVADDPEIEGDNVFETGIGHRTHHLRKRSASSWMKYASDDHPYTLVAPIHSPTSPHPVTPPAHALMMREIERTATHSPSLSYGMGQEGTRLPGSHISMSRGIPAELLEAFGFGSQPTANRATPPTTQRDTDRLLSITHPPRAHHASSKYLLSPPSPTETDRGSDWGGTPMPATFDSTTRRESRLSQSHDNGQLPLSTHAEAFLRSVQPQSPTWSDYHQAHDTRPHQPVESDLSPRTDRFSHISRRESEPLPRYRSVETFSYFSDGGPQVECHRDSAGSASMYSQR